MCCKAEEKDGAGSQEGASSNGDSVGQQEDVDGPPIDPSFYLAYELAAEKYKPAEFSRAQGWDGQTYVEALSFCAQAEGGYDICPYEAICPMGLNSEPLGGYNPGDQVWMPILDRANDWVQVSEVNPCIKFSAMNQDPPEWGTTGNGSEEMTGYITCCESEGVKFAAEQAYENAALKYMPLGFNREEGWAGQTYLEAVHFCGQDASRSLCPYEAICPMGTYSEPLGGYREEGEGGAWVPVLDNDGNHWVQISTENPCIMYTHDHAESPDWGLTGVGDEDITRHIICCEYDGEAESASTVVGTTTEAEAQAEAQKEAEDAAIDEVYLADAAHFEPNKYDRDDGWEGKTYLEAIRFCARTEGYEICPYQAICPIGAGREPLSGYVENDTGASWVPISDGANGWVNLSSENPCVQYRVEFSEHPEWGITGEGSEEFTRNIMCCKGSVLGTGEESFIYEIAAKKYHPLWYDRSDGWTGQTYDEAVDFCVTTKHMAMCPYDAHCPMAELDGPIGGVRLGGVQDELNGSWAPISDAINGWVSVGTENTCSVYDVVNGEPAEWGITGEGNEDMTRHIMCCKAEEKDGDDESQDVAGTPKPSKDPTPDPAPAPNPLPSIKPTPPPTPTSLPSIKPTLTPTPLPSKKPTPAPVTSAITTAFEAEVTETVAYNSVLKYNPVWYDRSSGWTGQTYDEAFSFCSKQGLDYDICPYKAICPGGPMKMPYGGSKDEPNGSWAPLNDAYNEWAQVSDLKACVHYKDMNPEARPAWGLTGENNEDITRHVACCDTDNLEGDISGVQGTGNLDSSDVNDKYAPTWYHREDGWVGKSYGDAIAFCAKQDSSIICPYEAYCPDGPGSTPTEGSREAPEAWAPIMDVPNGWVSVGSASTDSCELYNSRNPHPPLWGLVGHRSDEELGVGDVKDITAQVMCCREPLAGDKTTPLQSTVSTPIPIATTTYEQDILDKKHPIWYSRKDGYHGNTHQEAADFCKSVSGMVLCPAETYCPEGNPNSDKPLFLQKSAFEGEQWAPVATTDSNSNDKWILVGTLDGASQSTCATFDDVKGMKPKGWSVDDSDPELKENVLCCLNPNHLIKEINFAKDLDRVWLDESFGWKGGSHDDAMEFCKKLGNKKLCPYAAYCPHGAGQPVIGGHVEDFNMVGEQWAPVHHESSVHHETNYWVMIGQKYQNSATTCMDNWELEGHEPDWGMTEERADIKHYIMCCTFSF